MPGEGTITQIVTQFTKESLARVLAVQTDPAKLEQQDRAAYFMSEFFFGMLPCYVFSITVAIRYAKISSKPQTPSEFRYDETSKSFRVKTRISQFQAITYLLSLFLGIAGSPMLFWGAKFGLSNLFYLFGIFAWVLSAMLLKAEYIREQSQSLYAHRVFWIFSFCFSAIRLFQDYLALFNIILGIARSMSNVVLLMYAMYKPFDLDRAFQDYDEEVPSFARLFFEKFENNKFVAILIGYSLTHDNSNDDLQVPLSEDIELQDNPFGFVETILLEAGRTQASQNSFDLEKQLYNALPRRNVVLSQTVERRIEEGKPKFYYGVISQFGDSNYKVSKRFKEFESLQDELRAIYTLQNYPKLEKTFPLLEKINHNDAECEKKRVKAIQNWISEILHYPLFIHQKLLDFLEVKPISATPYNAYFTHVTKMKGSASFQKNPHQSMSSYTLAKNPKKQPASSQQQLDKSDLPAQLAHHFQTINNPSNECKYKYD